MVGRHSTALLSNIMSEDNQEQSRIITMREVDLRNVILTLIRNMTKVNKDNVIDKKAEDIEAVSVSVPQNLNLTISEDLSEDSDLALLMYLALFFLWYGAIIYGCLIGCGIYNKRRRTVTLYQAFVERTDLREQLRKRKEELRERRRHQRSHLPLQSIGGFHITQLVSSPRYLPDLIIRDVITGFSSPRVLLT